MDIISVILMLIGQPVASPVQQPAQSTIQSEGGGVPTTPPTGGGH